LQFKASLRENQRSQDSDHQEGSRSPLLPRNENFALQTIGRLKFYEKLKPYNEFYHRMMVDRSADRSDCLYKATIGYTWLADCRQTSHLTDRVLGTLQTPPISLKILWLVHSENFKKLMAKMIFLNF